MAISTTETARLPHKPGVYKFYNKQGTLIYVGKAKNLNKRVRSYFTRAKGHNRKTVKLVSEIDKIEFVLTNTEFDALLLENNLIKASQPKYNILLKDDKTFPFICVTNERFPRIYSTRQVNNAKGKFYGPYTSVIAMKNVMELVQKLYTIRTCNYNLSVANVANKKYKVCLEYHIGNCLGPCEGLQSEEDYQTDIDQVVSILKGKLGTVRNHFKTKMKEAAETLEFETANFYKDKLSLVDKFHSKSLVVNTNIKDLHVCSVITDEENSFINYMKVKNGAIIFSQSVSVKEKIELSGDELVCSLIWQFINLEKLPETGLELISNIPLTHLPEIIHASVPQNR